MNKLTKEQAEWLIDKVTQEERVYPGSTFTLGEIKEIINQCTEQEFPELIMKDINNNQILIGYWNDEQICINVPKQYLYMPFDQFKQFTEGCNKIVEWLNSLCSPEP